MDKATKSLLDAARLAVGGVIVGSSEGRAQCAAALTSLSDLEKHLEGLVADIQVVSEPLTSSDTVAVVAVAEPVQEPEQDTDAGNHYQPEGEGDL